MKLTPDELKVVQMAVRGAIDLRARYVKNVADWSPPVKRKKAKLAKELVHLRSAIAKLK